LTTTPTRSRRRGWRIFWILLLLAGVAAGAYYVFVARTQAGPPAVNVVAEPVTQGRFVREVTGSGVIEAERERALAFQTGGTIADVPIDEGDVITEGALLARLDDAELQRSLASTRASLASARADLTRTLAQQDADALDTENAVAQASDRLSNARADLRDREATVTRIERLLDLGAASRNELQTARDAVAAAERAVEQAELSLAAAERRRDNQVSLADASRASAEANVARLETDLANLEARLADTELRAPFTGVVATLTAEEGDVVGTQAIVEIADPGVLRIRASFDENRASELAVGMPADVVPDADTRLRFPATVERLSPVAAREGGTAQVDAILRFDPDVAETFRDDGQIVRPGYTVTVRVRVAEIDQALLVPLEALTATEEGDAPSVLYGVTPEPVEEGPVTRGTARRIPVTPLETNPTVAALEPGASGVEAGDWIIVVGVDAVEDGATVSFPPVEP